MIRAAIIGLIAGTLLGLASTLPAKSATLYHCIPTTREHLAENYGEVVLGAGIASNNVITRITTNLETGTWTIIITGPDGTCALASGQFWVVVEPPPSSDPS